MFICKELGDPLEEVLYHPPFTDGEVRVQGAQISRTARSVRI